ncbi:hypothetical protein LR393_34230 [Kineosporia mesophila]|nr:hypothetical protein [Kineosporia mesophila]MCD5355152.1 hypothetical protein [Kineosporia mesophila]
MAARAAGPPGRRVAGPPGRDRHHQFQYLTHAGARPGPGVRPELPRPQHEPRVHRHGQRGPGGPGHPSLHRDRLVPALNHQPEFAAHCVGADAEKALLDTATALAWAALDIAALSWIPHSLRAYHGWRFPA